MNPVTSKILGISTFLIIFIFVVQQAVFKHSHEADTADGVNARLKDGTRTKISNLAENSKRLRIVESKSSDLTDTEARWRAAADRLKGDNLISARKYLINEAGRQLEGMVLAEFLGNIINSGSFSDYEMSIISVAQLLFSDVSLDTDASLDFAKWIGDLSDASAQERLSHNFGYFYHGKSMDILDFLPDDRSRQSFLASYCSRDASHSPLKATSKYLEAIPKDGDYSGLVSIAASVNKNFEGFLAMIPPEAESVSPRINQEIFKTWGKLNPEDACNFIKSNSETVAAGYLKFVVDSWLTINPQAAVDWSMSLDSGEYRGVAVRAIAESWKKSDPEKAWNLIKHEPQNSESKGSLEKIYQEWLKIDRQAAESAKLDLAPSSRNFR